jgi:actin-like ATPase involved in cell morphogenesis
MNNNGLSNSSKIDAIPFISRKQVTAKVPRKIEIDGDRVRNGLAQLVLTLVKLLHELLERQAIRRMDSGSLSDEEIERLGMTLMCQAEELENMCKVFGLKDEDLNLNLGPLGRLL